VATCRCARNIEAQIPKHKGLTIGRRSEDRALAPRHGDGGISPIRSLGAGSNPAPCPELNRNAKEVMLQNSKE